MRVEGTYSLDVDRQTVWDGLMTPEVMAACIPGCERFEAAGQDTYDVSLKVGVAAISGSYTGKVSLTDKVPLESYRMVVEGKGAGGTVRGEAHISLVETPGATELRVVGEAQVTGVVARVGQRLMGSASKMMMGQFFNCLKAKLEDR